MQERCMAADRYAVSVDISAKIEAWDKPSLVAVANDHTRVLLVTAATKQAAARLLANSEEPAQYALMAVLAYLAVRHEIDHLSSITLDRDYSGEIAERIIVRRLAGAAQARPPPVEVVCGEGWQRRKQQGRPSGTGSVQREAEGGWRDHAGGDHGAAVRQKIGLG
jgi:hypothetical protein